MEKDEKKYELGYLLDGNLEEDAANGQAKDIEAILEQKGGVIVERTLPKKRRLAYKIGRNYFGYFGTIVFTAADNEVVSKTERDFKLKKDILRFIFIKIVKEPERRDEIIAPKLRIKKPAPAPQVIETTERKETEKPAAVEPQPAPSRIKLEELDQKLEEILGK